jgi:hypothetical protein
VVPDTSKLLSTCRFDDTSISPLNWTILLKVLSLLTVKGPYIVDEPDTSKLPLKSNPQSILANL